MKKLILLCGVLLLVCGMAGSAGADLLPFSETFLGHSGDSSLLAINNQTYNFLFDLTSDGITNNYYQLATGGTKIPPTSDATGFNPGVLTIKSATLSFSFYDTDNQKESVLVKTGASDGNLTIGNYNNLDLSQKKKGHTSESFNYTFNSADFTWLKDGKLTLTVSSSDSIQLDQLRLDVEGDTQPVPLPNAAWLLGSSLIGLIATSRLLTRCRFAG